MAVKVDDLSIIDSSKEAWNIVVKVIRLWVSPNFGGRKLPFSMELVLMDAKGTKIHASVKKTLVYLFQPLLTGGRVYNISYFGVGENGGEFKTTSHPFKLNFHKHTSVRLETKIAISKSPYSCTPLSDIMFRDPDSSFLVDVIGILTGSSGEQEFEKNGKIEKRVTIELCQDGVRMECCFFGKYVPLILGQLASGDMTNAVVLVNYAKIKPFRGNPSIQNVYGATQIFIIKLCEASESQVEDSPTAQSENPSSIVVAAVGNPVPAVSEKVMKSDDSTKSEGRKSAVEPVADVPSDVLGKEIQDSTPSAVASKNFSNIENVSQTVPQQNRSLPLAAVGMGARKAKNKKLADGVVAGTVCHTDDDDDVAVGSQCSPPTKRSSPSDSEPLGSSNAGKKLLKAVKKEKI
ncbi:uncharacterized protein LOC130713232 [Lotus japonicus]|uniref:uncharacterized protein LOC130713232 n=1 Tax=Lotus japonicus TaxID=34305 RepID=UPI00258637F7|nr:uncharacterized protein LOC130713232 [Lotus japonicus]